MNLYQINYKPEATDAVKYYIQAEEMVVNSSDSVVQFFDEKKVVGAFKKYDSIIKVNPKKEFGKSLDKKTLKEIIETANKNYIKYS